MYYQEHLQISQVTLRRCDYKRKATKEKALKKHTFYIVGGKAN